MDHTDYHPQFWGLPDPDVQAEFYADVPTKRLIAWIVDVVIIVLLTVLALPFTAFTGLFFFPALYMVIGFVYRALTLSKGSATLGMRLVSIEIRTREGTRLDPVGAVLHTLCYAICTMTMLLQVVSIGLMLGSARKQGLHDHLLGTAAINRAAAY